MVSKVSSLSPRSQSDKNPLSLAHINKALDVRARGALVCVRAPLSPEHLCPALPWARALSPALCHCLLLSPTEDYLSPRALPYSQTSQIPPWAPSPREGSTGQTLPWAPTCRPSGPRPLSRRGQNTPQTNLRRNVASAASLLGKTATVSYQGAQVWKERNGAATTESRGFPPTRPRYDKSQTVTFIR